MAEAKAINKLFAKEGDPTRTILAGDMNATPEAEPIQVLLQRWTNAIDDPPAPSAPSVNPRSRIDYIFYRGVSDFRQMSSKVIDESLASDHRPVLAELELLPRPQ